MHYVIGFWQVDAPVWLYPRHNRITTFYPNKHQKVNITLPFKHPSSFEFSFFTSQKSLLLFLSSRKKTVTKSQREKRASWNKIWFWVQCLVVFSVLAPRYFFLSGWVRLHITPTRCAFLFVSLKLRLSHSLLNLRSTVSETVIGRGEIRGFYACRWICLNLKNFIFFILIELFCIFYNKDA